MVIANNTSTSKELLDWTREFAEITLPICANPSVEMVRQAIAIHLPEKLAEVPPGATVEEVLEQVLGICVIVQYGRERIGWVATTDPVEANVLQQRYSSNLYSKVRHDLRIDGHWIFLPDPQFLDHYFDEDLYEKAPDPIEVYEQFPEFLHLEDRQESVVVKL